MKRFFHQYDGGRTLCAVLVAVLWGVGAAGPVHAQFVSSFETQEVPAKQRINLFASWGGEVAIDGFFVKLPAGWQLEEVVALQPGTQGTTLEVRPSEGGEHFIGTEETLREATEFILQVHTGEATVGSVRWSLVPFTYRERQRLRRLRRHRLERRVEVAPPSAPVEGNHVLSFEAGAPPLLLDQARLPSLSTRTSFTVETWIKTTGLGEVVLSTWNGSERRSYPLEMVIDAAGRLRYYRGRPGRHESMATTHPVADGMWHHVAIVHEPEAGCTRLLLDGLPVDSLRGAVPLEASGNMVALGGRVPSPGANDASTAGMSGFSGQFDEVHFWPQARASRTVRRTMRRPRRRDATGAEAAERSASGQAEPVLLHFEKDWPHGALAHEPRGVERIRSDLRFYAPITDLRAEVRQDGISLSWSAPTGRGTFVIERAAGDGDFRVVGQREAQAERQQYTFTDPDAAAEVVYYRIRQELEVGPERLSGTLKVGRGSSEKEGVTLMGNFPNPFSEETTIAYKVHEKTEVHLTVWDLTGQRVATLVNKAQGPGYKEVVFQPENLSSGTYFVRLRADGQTHTRKIAFLK